MKRLLALFLLLSSPSLFADQVSAKPNFIFVITDDISPDDLGPYGNKFVQTPNLDRLAKRALVFDRAYLTISSCSPSRCSIITGRYPHNTGAPELHTTLPPDQKTFVQALQKAGYHTVLSGKNHMGKPAQLGFDTSSDSNPAGSEKWVQHLRDRPKDKPFFCWFASHDAHHGWQLNDKAPTYDPAKVTVPPMLFDGPGTREELANYYHEVSRTDHYVGLVLAELEAQGIADNTYLIYCSDNGRPFPRCKTYLYDSGIKSPLIIAGPRVTPGRTSSLVSSIDYSATILDLAGIRKLPTIQGLSFQKILTDPKATTRNVVFSERNWHVYQNHARSVRQGDWLYVWNAFPDRSNLSAESANFTFPAVRELWQAAEEGKLSPALALLTKPSQPAEMLFNVKSDPDQLNNLADQEEHYGTLTQLRQHLASWTDQTGDNVPTNPTPDRQQQNEKRGKDPKRVEFPGAQNNATSINNPGPILVADLKKISSTKANGYKGIWFTLGQVSEFGDKYSGGLGTYTAKHVPLAIYSPVVNKTFFVYGGTTAATERRLLVMASEFDHATNTVPKPTIVLDKTAELGVNVNDPHDNPALAMDDDGYLWIFVSARSNHRQDFTYKSTRPYSADAFGLVEAPSGDKRGYPQIFHVPGKGFIHLFTLYQPGRELYCRTSADGITWNPKQHLADMEGHYQCTWRNGDKIATMFNRHPGRNVDERTDLFYLQTTDFGATWTTVEGTPVTLPIASETSPCSVFDYSGANKLVYLNDLNFDKDGHPVLFYTTASNATGNAHQPGPFSEPRKWVTAHWSGTSWDIHALPASATATSTVTHNYDTGCLHVDGDTWRIIGPSGPPSVSPQDNPKRFWGQGGEMEVWESTTQGTTWAKVHQTTLNSPRNQGYARKTWNAADPFATFWCDGNPDELTESHLYFSNKEGTRFWELPYNMTTESATPIEGKPLHTGHDESGECPVDFDFPDRDSLPQTDRPFEKWNTKWGPPAKTYPAFTVPDCITDPLTYQRQRVIAVAKKYLGLSYQHKHIPAAGGLDCSNFTAWVYNYGFGIRFSSGIEKQAETAGRRLDPDEKLLPGDLLFQTIKDGITISHVVIYLGDGKIIDATNGKVAIRKNASWYVARHSHARRIIE